MLKAISNEQTEALDAFFFADDMKKLCSNRRENTKKVDQVSDLCDSYDLTIYWDGISTSTWKAL